MSHEREVTIMYLKIVFVTLCNASISSKTAEVVVSVVIIAVVVVIAAVVVATTTTVELFVYLFIIVFPLKLDMQEIDLYFV